MHEIYLLVLNLSVDLHFECVWSAYWYVQTPYKERQKWITRCGNYAYRRPIQNSMYEEIGEIVVIEKFLCSLEVNG
jgi:hypothetical protein